MLKLFSMHLFTSTKPGSEIVGVPASEINETTFYFFIELITSLLIFFSLNSFIIYATNANVLITTSFLLKYDSLL